MEKEQRDVSFWVYESSQHRSDKIIHKLIIALLIAVGLLFASNALWLCAWCQFDYSAEEKIFTQDGAGVNIIGSRNGVDYGAASEDTNEAQDEEER